MNRAEIIQNLREFTQNEGIVFLSEKDSINYFKNLVELIEKLIELSGGILDA